jgi:hypothetical protein
MLLEVVVVRMSFTAVVTTLFRAVRSSFVIAAFTLVVTFLFVLTLSVITVSVTVTVTVAFFR